MTESTASPWDIDARTDEAPLITFYRDAIASEIRKSWKTLDRVIVFWRRGGKWLPTGIAISMPQESKKRDQVTPENGAEHLLARIVQHVDKYGSGVYIAVRGYGSSKSGETAQQLFQKQIDTKALSEDEPDEPGSRAGKSSRGSGVDIVAIDALTKQSEANFNSYLKVVDKCTELLDRQIKMADSNTANSEVVVSAMKIQFKERQREREHEMNMRQQADWEKKTDDLWGKLTPVLGSVFDDLIRKHMGMGADVVTGTFSERLKAILAKVPEDKTAEARRILGDKAWDSLRRASEGVTDEAFTQIARAAIIEIPGDPQAKFMQLLPVIGQERVAELVMLLKHAKVAD